MKTKQTKNQPNAQTEPAKPRSVQRVAMRGQRIFSGDSSVKMWEEINSAKTVSDLRMALYVVCCRLQELEEKVERKTSA